MPIDGELEAVLQLLPACRRCRTARKRCDTLLPACANCSRSGVECSFYDHISNEVLPREYIASMVQHLRRLESPMVISSAKDSPTSPSNPINPLDGDKYIHTRGSYRLLGKRAPLAVHTEVDITLEGNSRPHVRVALPPSAFPRYQIIDNDMHAFLINTYLESLHPLFPVLDSTASCFQCPQLSCDDMESSPWQIFSQRMIYSIACHCLAGNDTRLALLSDALYREASVQIQLITRDQGIEALQAILLLALRSQFDVDTGSIGQLVAFAHRLEVQLSSREAHKATPALQWLQCTAYCLTQQVSIALDRPYNYSEPDSMALQATTARSRLLCSLYMKQSQYQSHGVTANEPDVTMLDTYSTLNPSPIIYTTMCQTEFMIHPSVESAMQLLSAYQQQEMIFNIFTSHWVSKAASYVIQHADNDTTVQASISGSQILERCATKWPSARTLQNSLQNSTLTSRKKADTSPASDFPGVS